jgi:hypothetical protein
MALTKVTNTGIADDAVTTDKIEDGTVVAADIAPGTIANAKLANNSITLNGSSVSLGGSATVKHIDWQALTVADGSTTLNTTAGKGYFLDTNAGVIEVFLPSSPTRGDTVVLADYSGTFATNQIIINTGGQLLDSTAGNDFKVTTNNSIVELVYVDAAKGWLVKLNQAAGTTPSSVLTDGLYDQDDAFISATGGTVTTSGDYKIHTFTGDGCFVVSQGPVNTPDVDYLVVAGGGAGGASPQWNGGGGAGGFRVSNSLGLPAPTTSPLANPTGVTVTATTYPITVGSGGSVNSPPAQGSPGSNSVFSTITSTGGGGGGGQSNGPTAPGLPGGSGGGAGEGGPSYPGGSGNTPPVSPPQGNPGGLGGGNSGSGGGGASQTGQGGGTPGVPGGAGGATGGVGGTGSYISPSFAVGCAGTTGPVCGVRYFGGGGGGGGQYGPAQGGSGGGGKGARSPEAPPGNAGDNGIANTGGGGGGSAYLVPGCAGAGGKGIVILRYKFQ